MRFVEIRNFYKKLLFLSLFFSLVVSFILFGVYFIVEEIINPDQKVSTLLEENQHLMEKLADFSNKYKSLEKRVDEITKKSNDLRLYANIPVLKENDLNFGVGGKVYEKINPSTSEEVSEILRNLDTDYDEINLKINFEKDNFKTIESTFDSNQKLYDAIPAIKPTMEGYFGDRFGMRMHPILKIRRMHNGMDIVCNTGTKVYAPGAGTVVFAGRKGGYGWLVEIDHGFGYKTRFAHLSKIKVKKYQKVKRGDLLALSGRSGRLSTGPHLHYEIRHNGVVLNPRNFIFDDVTVFDIKKDKNEGEKSSI